MKKERNVTKAPGLIGKYLFFFALPSLKSINNFSHIVSSFINLSVRKKLIVIESTIEMSGVALNFLKKEILKIIGHKGELCNAKMLFFY